MEALILSCGTGGGHNSAGKAVMEELNRRGHHAVMLNPYTLRSSRLAGRIDKIYISTAQRAPKVFGAVYKAGDLYRKLPGRSPVYFVNRKMIPVMQAYLAEHHVDIVIMPHLFPAEILTNMKCRGLKIPKTMFVATDYCCIPFTEETDCDAYVIPAADLRDDFSGRGIPKEKLYPYGIPVQRSFADAVDRQDAKGRLGLAADKKYILISGGSMGAGNIDKMLRMLLTYADQNSEVRLIVICGNNQKLYEKLSRKYGEQAVVIGHTEQMADYMKACHLYLTKPGGLSSTEAAVCGIPLVHMPPIPGCETKNARYFCGHNMSVSCEVTKEGMEKIFELLRDERICAVMTECQKKCINKDAAVWVCELAEALTMQ